MVDEKNKTDSGTQKLDDIVGSSDQAGSGGTQKFNLDDIDFDDELETPQEESEEEKKPDEDDVELSFGDSDGDAGELEMDDGPAADPEPEPAAEADASGSMELDMSDDLEMDDDMGLESTPKPDVDQSSSMEIELSADDEDDYEAAPDDAADEGLTGDQIYEQSQSSIKIGGAATNSDISLSDDLDIDDDGMDLDDSPAPVSAKAPAPNKVAPKAPEKNAKPRKATKHHNPNCNFCKIALRRFKLMTIYEDDHVIAIMDPKPLMKGQVLICTKTHKSSLSDFSPEENSHFFHVAKIISDAIKKSKIPAEAVSYFMSESVNEKDELKHVYMSLIPRKQKDGIGLKFSKKNAVSLDDLELIGDHLIGFITG